MKILYQNFFAVKNKPKTKEQRDAWEFYCQLYQLFMTELNKHNDYTKDVAMSLLKQVNNDAEILAKKIEEQQL